MGQGSERGRPDVNSARQIAGLEAQYRVNQALVPYLVEESFRAAFQFYDVCIVIPCRMGSQRLPSKPVLADTGRTLLEETVANLLPLPPGWQLVVAEDTSEASSNPTLSESIAEWPPDPRCQILPTGTHANGTDRAAQIAGREEFACVPWWLIVQVDEPEIDPSALLRMVRLLRKGERHVTLAAPIPSVYKAKTLADDPRFDRNVVKVAVDETLSAQAFNRKSYQIDYEMSIETIELLHVGVYGFCRPMLLEYAETETTYDELSESLEQLRIDPAEWQVVVVDHAYPAINTPADYATFVERRKGIDAQEYGKT